MSTQQPKKKRPIIGLVGILIALFGCGLSIISQGATFAIILFAVGILIVIYAMITGNLTLFG